MESPAVLGEAERQQRLAQWSASSGVNLALLDSDQRAVVVAALTFLGFVGGLAALRRMVAYLLAHCGMGLSSTVIGAVVGTSDRAVRKGRQSPPREFWRRLRKARRGHAPPKLRPEHVGLVAKFLSEHKRCSVAELLGFIHKSFGVTLERHTLRRFLERYGLGCLREEAVVGPPLSRPHGPWRRLRTDAGGGAALPRGHLLFWPCGRAPGGPPRPVALLQGPAGRPAHLPLRLAHRRGLRLAHWRRTPLPVAPHAGRTGACRLHACRGQVRPAHAAGGVRHSAPPCVSIDEHVVARFTRRFLIPKGFHTIRNKKMRAEKLFFSFDTATRTLLDLVVTPGNGRLAPVASKMLGALRARCRDGLLRAVLDAGAAQSHRELLEVADHNHNQVLLVRVPRRKAYLDCWKALPEERFTAHDEPGRYKGAPAKRIHVTETTTSIRAAKGEPVRQVRTLVVREQKRRGKERWHALFVFRDNATDALSLIKEYRARQRHEQAYRILLHDAFVDTVPSGYSKHSRDPDRPGFRKNAVTLYAWLAGLAVNALTDFSAALPERFKWAHPRTLRRWWFNFPADLYLTDRALFVVLHPRWFRSWWEQKVGQLNAQKVRIPWMNDRLVLYSLDAPLPESPEPSSAPSTAPSDVRC